MSITTGYDQYLRKYRLLISSKVAKTSKVKRQVSQEVQVGNDVGTVTGGTVYYRKGPGTGYKAYGTKKRGTKLEIVGKSGKWYKFLCSNGAGGVAWMSGKYVKITGKAQTKTVTSEVEETVTTYQNTAFDVSNLRCVFSCEKSMDETPNYSQITVYNLKADTIASIKAGDTVILEAGYENGNYGMIFTGQIVQPYTKKESATDMALILIVQDGDEFLTSAFTAQTIGKSATQQDIARICLGDTASAGLISKQISKAKLPRGRVLFGKSASYLSRIAKANKSQLYIEDGKVNIVAASDYDESTAVELNPSTGLIGIPSQTDDGVSGQCLINPSIKLNTLLHINANLITSKQVAEGETSVNALSTDGIYRVTKLTYEGDTHGDAWYCNFEAITQAGAKPAGLTGNETNPWR